jgi:hypothetical protein
MGQLVSAILAAWREAERESDALDVSGHGESMAARLHVLREAYRLAVSDDVDDEVVARFLDEHGLGEVVPKTAGD